LFVKNNLIAQFGYLHHNILIEILNIENYFLKKQEYQIILKQYKINFHNILKSKIT